MFTNRALHVGYVVTVGFMTSPAEAGEPQPDTEDTVAEIDDEPDLAADDDTEDEDERPLYVGTCHNGPWDGRTVTSRYPKGLLVVDREQRSVWIYDRQPDGSYEARGGGAHLPLDDTRRWQAAESGDYEVIAAAAASGTDDEAGPS